MLSRIDEDIVAAHVSKQVSRIIVHTQEELIHEFSSKGVLRDRDAEFLTEEIRKNSERLYDEWLERCAQVNEGCMYSDHVTAVTSENANDDYANTSGIATTKKTSMEISTPSLDGLV